MQSRLSAFLFRTHSHVQKRCRSYFHDRKASFASSSKPPGGDEDYSFLGVLSKLSVFVRFGAAAYVTQVYVINSTMSVGPSMLPTFNVRGDVLLTEYLSPRLNLIKSGDIVVAVKPVDPSVSVLKRVRGMGGERIWVHPRGEPHPVQYKVPEGFVWLEGDNSSQSTDSREYGPVPYSLIKGRVILRFWPPRQAGFVKSMVIDHTESERLRNNSATSARDFNVLGGRNHFH